MNNIACPHCGQETISIAQRFKSAHWFTINCSSCGGRIAMQPILMAMLYFVHTWNIFFFGFMSLYEKSAFYFTAMVIGWLLLEFFGLYIPFVRLKRRPPQDAK